MPVLTLKDLFIQSQDAQNQTVQHELIKKFHQLYKSAEPAAFLEEFIFYARHPMTVYAREPCVEKTIDFISKAIVHVANKDKKKSPEQPTDSDGAETEEDDDEHPLLTGFLSFLLDHHSARERAVRFRVCQLVTRLLQDMGEAAIDEDLYDRIFRCMVERLRDKSPQVRVHAVLALKRLQDPSDDACPIIKAFMILMTKDPNMEIRRIILTVIVPSAISLEAILERTRDVKQAVRCSAYSVIAEKVPIRSLTIQQRVDLLQNVLSDRSEVISKSCSSKLLQTWLTSMQGNVLDLLDRLDVQASVATCEKALAVLFKTSSVLELVQNFDILDEKQLIPPEKLTCESAFYWRNVVHHVKAQGHDYEEQLEKVLPNCLEFCAYIKKFSKQLRDITDIDKMIDLEFIMEQLLQLASMMDFSDSASMKATEKLMHNLLVSDNCGPSLVEHIMPCLSKVKTNTDQLVTYIAETVSDIREPITRTEIALSTEEQISLDKRVASIRVKVNELRQELSDCVERQEFERAAHLKSGISELDAERSSLLEKTQPTVEEVRTVKDDPLTILKCLTIICELLINNKITRWSPELNGLMESQILQGVMNLESEVRKVAIKAIGLCCHINKDLIMQHLPLLLKASQMDSTHVREAALRAIFDIVLIYGLDLFSTGDEQNKTLDAADSSTTSVTAANNESMASVNDSLNSSRKGNSVVDEEDKKNWSETASKVVAILSTNLNSEVPELRCVSALGLSKLILTGRVVSARLLSHLVLLWFNPLMEDDDTLSQILGAFFPQLAFSSSENQQLMESAFLPTLRTLINAPLTSPLSEVNEINVASFLIELTDARNLVENVKSEAVVLENPCHDNLAVEICNEILSDPDDAKIWLRILNQLNISPENKTLHRDLSKLAEEIAIEVTDKLSLKMLDKFRAVLSDLQERTKEVTQQTVEESVVGAEDAGETDSNTVVGDEDTQPGATPAKGRKSVSIKTPAARRTTRSSRSAAVFATPFATPRSKAARDKEVEGTCKDLENLVLEHSAKRTPMVPGTPKTPKRPLHTIQDPTYE